MKILTTFLLLLLCGVASAQVDEDAEPTLQPRILALDDALSIGNRFNDEIGKQAAGYKLVFTEKSIPKTIRQVYKTEENETLRIEYKYALDGGDSEDTNEKPVVTFQSISGEASIIAKIYSFLFDTTVDPGQLAAIATPGTEITYKGAMHQFILEADDYAPGYWTMSFVR